MQKKLLEWYIISRIVDKLCHGLALVIKVLDFLFQFSNHIVCLFQLAFSQFEQSVAFPDEWGFRSTNNYFFWRKLCIGINNVPGWKNVKYLFGNSLPGIEKHKNVANYYFGISWLQIFILPSIFCKNLVINILRKYLIWYQFNANIYFGLNFLQISKYLSTWLLPIVPLHRRCFWSRAQSLWQQIYGAHVCDSMIV